MFRFYISTKTRIREKWRDRCVLSWMIDHQVVGVWVCGCVVVGRHRLFSCIYLHLFSRVGVCMCDYRHLFISLYVCVPMDV